MRDVKGLAEAFAAVARPEIRQDHTASSCIASTWITLEVMRRFRIAGQPMTVQVDIYNAAFVRREALLGRRPRTRDEAIAWSEQFGTWSVGVGLRTESMAQGINGHLVAILDEHLLIDASIDQANVPAHGILLPGVLIAVAPVLFLDGFEPLRCDVNGSRVVYRVHHLADDFTGSYDWGHNLETDGAVDRILAHLAARGCRPDG